MSSTSSQPPTSILLLGAGELGTAILTSLAAHPSLASTQLTVALRPSTVSSSSSRLDALRAVAPPARQQSNPIAFAPLDLAAPSAEADLTALILNDGKPFDTVICCTGFATSGSGTAASGTQTLIARAVLAASSSSPSKRRLRFFPWQFGADYDATGPDAAHGMMAEQCGVRALLRARAAAANLDWTIVSTGMFMSFVFEEWFGVVAGLGAALKAGGPEPLSDEGSRVVVRCLGSWETHVTLTDVRDIGAVVVELVAAPPQPQSNDGDAGSVVFAAGQTVSYAELADVVQKVVGRRAKVQREEWSLEYLRAELEKNPEDQTKKYRVLFGEGKGVAWDKEKTINAERNIESMGVEQWLREKLSM